LHERGKEVTRKRGGKTGGGQKKPSKGRRKGCSGSVEESDSPGHQNVRAFGGKKRESKTRPCGKRQGYVGNQGGNTSGNFRKKGEDVDESQFSGKPHSKGRGEVEERGR